MTTTFLCAEDRVVPDERNVLRVDGDVPHRLAGGRLNVLLGAVWAGNMATGDMLDAEPVRHAMRRLLAEVAWPPEQVELLFRELLERYTTDLEHAWPLLNAQLVCAASIDQESSRPLESTFFGANWESQQPLQLVYRSAPERALEMLDGCALFTPRAHQQLLALAIASDDLEWVRRIVERMRARDIAMPLRWPGAMHHDFADQLGESFWHCTREDAKVDNDDPLPVRCDPREAWTYWSTHPVDLAQEKDEEMGVAKLRPLCPPKPDLDAFLPCVVKLCPHALPCLLDGDDYTAEHRSLALATALGLCMHAMPFPPAECQRTSARLQRALARAEQDSRSATSRITLAMVASALDDQFAAEFEQACEDPEWQPLLLAAEILMSPPYAVQLGEDPLRSGLTEAGEAEEPLPDLRDRSIHWLSARLSGLVRARVPFLAFERVDHASEPMTPAAARAGAPYNADAVAHRPVLYEPRSVNHSVIALWRTRKFAELVAERVWAPDGEAGAALRAEQAGSGRWAR